MYKHIYIGLILTCRLTSPENKESLEYEQMEVEIIENAKLVKILVGAGEDDIAVGTPIAIFKDDDDCEDKDVANLHPENMSNYTNALWQAYRK